MTDYSFCLMAKTDSVGTVLFRGIIGMILLLVFFRIAGPLGTELTNATLDSFGYGGSFMVDVVPPLFMLIIGAGVVIWVLDGIPGVNVQDYL